MSPDANSEAGLVPDPRVLGNAANLSRVRGETVPLARALPATPRRLSTHARVREHNLERSIYEPPSQTNSDAPTNPCPFPFFTRNWRAGGLQIQIGRQWY
eukprot:836672-Rhodomonas_salina.2